MKTLVFILILTLFGCSSKIITLKFNTEIICPSFSYRFLVLNSTPKEVEQSIENAIAKSLKSNESNRYTVLYFSNNRNTSIYNITPQQIKQECFLEERLKNI
jgi:hypothetical protein